MVFLVITDRDSGDILDTAELCWSSYCQSRILPKRPADKSRDGEKLWFVAKDKRRAMGKHVVHVLESVKDRGVEELYGYFGLVGLGNKWVDSDDVDWSLLKTNSDEIKE